MGDIVIDSIEGRIHGKKVRPSYIEKETVGNGTEVAIWEVVSLRHQTHLEASRSRLM
jgi:hypothetical protein